MEQPRRGHESLPALRDGARHDGIPRAAPTALGVYEDVANAHILVGADGERALLVYSGEPMGGMGGVHTLPLACATH